MLNCARRHHAAEICAKLCQMIWRIDLSLAETHHARMPLFPNSFPLIASLENLPCPAGGCISRSPLPTFQKNGLTTLTLHSCFKDPVTWGKHDLRLNLQTRWKARCFFLEGTTLRSDRRLPGFRQSLTCPMGLICHLSNTTPAILDSASCVNSGWRQKTSKSLENKYLLMIYFFAVYLFT